MFIMTSGECLLYLHKAAIGQWTLDLTDGLEMVQHFVSTSVDLQTDALSYRINVILYLQVTVSAVFTQVADCLCLMP